jgi:hypothetical protein
MCCYFRRKMSLAAARPLISVYSPKNEASGSTVCLPAVFRAPIRPDIVSVIHNEIAKNRRQPYCVSEAAGHQTSAESWGMHFYFFIQVMGYEFFFYTNPLVSGSDVDREPQFFTLAEPECNPDPVPESGSGSGTGFRSGINLENKIQNQSQVKHERPTFWELMQLLTIKRRDFVQIFVWKNCQIWPGTGTGTGTGTGPETFPKSELVPQHR